MTHEQRVSDRAVDCIERECVRCVSMFGSDYGLFSTRCRYRLAQEHRGCYFGPQWQLRDRGVIPDRPIINHPHLTNMDKLQLTQPE